MRHSKANHRGDDKRKKHLEADHFKTQSHNLHAHVLLTTRSVDRNGFGLKVREWNKKTLLRQWRKQWAEYQNRVFERKGLEVRISHLSYKEQGLDREPGIHLGPVLAALELEKGIKTKHGDKNRAIEARNKKKKEKLRGKNKKRERSIERARENNRDLERSR